MHLTVLLSYHRSGENSIKRGCRRKTAPFEFDVKSPVSEAGQFEKKPTRQTPDRKIKKVAASWPKPYAATFCRSNYSAAIAPVGQADSQAPQSMQESVTTYLVSPSSMAPVGQVLAQAPHFTHSSEITCMVFTSKHQAFGGISPSSSPLLHEWADLSMNTE